MKRDPQMRAQKSTKHRPQTHHFNQPSKGRLDMNFQKRPMHMRRNTQKRETNESSTQTHHFNHPMKGRLDVDSQKRPKHVRKKLRKRATKEY